MTITFENIYNHIISMDKFPLKWRFTEARYDILPDLHLEELKPLNVEAAKFLWDYILNTNLHDDIPFKKEFYKKVEKVTILKENRREIKKWLYQRGFPFNKEVFLSWNETEAMIVPWKLLIKYFDSFYYTGSDDLTVIDQSLSWALLFFHEDEVYFGTNREIK